MLTNCRQATEIRHEEIFGPVAPVETFHHLDEAIASANETAMHACNDQQLGETSINREHFEAIQGFDAGWRKSGIGGVDGKHGL